MSYIKHRDGLSPAFVTIHDSFFGIRLGFPCSEARKHVQFLEELGLATLRCLEKAPKGW